MDERARLQRELAEVRDEVSSETERHIMTLARLRIREARLEQALRTLPVVGTLGTVDTSRGGNISASKLRYGTPWQAHLLSRGQSIPEWAAAQRGVVPDVEVVRSWVKRPGKGGRPIPRLWANRLAAEFSDPALADPAAWPSGIRE